VIRVREIPSVAVRKCGVWCRSVARHLRVAVGTRLIWLLPCLIAPPMILAAEASGWEVLLFPEALSLAFLVWAERRSEVNGSRWRIGVVPTLCATLGIAATNIPAPRWLIALTVMGIALLILQLTRTRIAPAMSAAVLPVIFGEHGFAYLITVISVTVLLAVTARRTDDTSVSADGHTASSAELPDVPGSPDLRSGRWPWTRIIAFGSSAHSGSR
jgi:hypothetical protein